MRDKSLRQNRRDAGTKSAARPRVIPANGTKVGTPRLSGSQITAMGTMLMNTRMRTLRMSSAATSDMRST
jgi:hypothetical protein